MNRSQFESAKQLPILEPKAIQVTTPKGKVVLSPGRVEIQSLNKKDQHEIKEDNFKNIVQPLPIILAETPYDVESPDFQYFEGCNLLHRHQYDEAFKVFTKASLKCDDQKTKQILLFNKAYALYKLNGKSQECREIWEQISNQGLNENIKLLALINLTTISCYHDLTMITIPPNNHDFENVLKCAKQLDSAFQIVIKMSHSLIDPRSHKALPVPTWLSIDTLIGHCR